MPELRAQRWRVVWWREVVWPFVLLAGLFGAVVLANVDMRLSGEFYSPAQGWLWRDNYWLSAIVHDLGHKVMLGVYLLVCLAWGASYWRPRWRPLSSALGYLILAVMLSVLVVNLGKRFIHFPCPWDLSTYGGHFPGVVSAYSWATQAPGCFPAGHSSSGYAWLCLYFVAKVYRPSWRFYGLAAAMAIGLLFGLGQQLRGAHFLSHDLATMACSWLVAAVLFHFWPKQSKIRPAN